MEKTEGSRRPSRDGWMGAGLGCGVALLGGIALGGAAQLAVVRGIGNPESLGRATVYAALAVLALAAGSGVAWALRARRSAAMAAVVALTLTVAPLGAAVRGPDRFPYPPPNEEERSPPQPFERDGTQVWIQPALGLELLAPEGLRLQQSDGLPVPTTTDPSDDSASIQWSWTNDSRDRALIILVALTIAYDDPGQNARYVDGVLTGELEGLGPAGFAVLEAERRGPSEQVVLAQHDLLGTVFMRTVAYRHGDALVMVTATAMGRQHTHLIPVVESVRGRPEYTTPP